MHVYYLPQFWLYCVFLILSLLFFITTSVQNCLHSIQIVKKVKPALFCEPWPTALRLSQRFFFISGTFLGDLFAPVQHILISMGVQTLTKLFVPIKYF